MNTNPTLYTTAEISKISESVSVLDYFLHLEKLGKVNFDRKSGNDYYFRTNDNKFSVSENQYYDFKTGKGGQIIKAVMELEKIEWKDALEFLKNFNGQVLEQNRVAEKRKVDFGKKNTQFSEVIITNCFIPNNEKLVSYFEKRGISKDILIENTRQIHYESAGKKYFGIGIENLSQGIEIRNPLMKSKIGRNDISELKGTKNEMIVFEGMTDMLSFLQLLKANNQKNNRTLITLNSITNVDRFLDRYKDFSGKIFLCFDGDKAGNIATQQLLKAFNESEIKDIRSIYNISETGNNDLNDYLQNKIKLQNKNINLVEQNSSENKITTIKSNRICKTEQVEQKSLEQDSGELGENFKSRQKQGQSGGQRLDSKVVRDGFTMSEPDDLSERGNEQSTAETQQSNAPKNEKTKHSLHGSSDINLHLNFRITR